MTLMLTQPPVTREEDLNQRGLGETPLWATVTTTGLVRNYTYRTGTLDDRTLRSGFEELLLRSTVRCLTS